MLIILVIAIVALVSAGTWFFYACTAPGSKFFRPVLVSGSVQGRVIALTFDDGPASPFTEQILDILRSKKVPATFFVCGQNVERYPEITHRIAREGHILGNHTFSHPFLFFRSNRFMAEEIDRAQGAIEKASGFRPTVFRPPYGIRWPGLLGVLRTRGMKLIMWSATGYDWKLQADGIVKSALKNLSPGAVLLLHDGHELNPAAKIDRSGTIKALPKIIDLARAEGFEFVPLGEFLGT